ncbi:hypothetical protein [Streptomyces sp. 11-1-2]|uniref:hypothetical protein n=1 Tax=unclassified Streptomyces TaxID=2593676 RepID=UPI000B8DB890|nr:hypothetical protein [Streptomyces sp. 11-1-2]ASQ93410.1 hypothetical protein CGL27_10150 [Streptomyces sp. 11-1-2]
MSSSPAPAGRPARKERVRTRRTDYAGAVYGSLLAASVVATAGAAGDFPRLQLIVLLLVTGVVFWAAHVYAHVAGERIVGRPISRREVRRVARREWPIVEAAVLPAVAAALSPVLGLGLSGTAWLVLAVAVAQQVAWATFGAINAGASRRMAVGEGVVNLLLGLVIVAAKAALGH